MLSTNLSSANLSSANLSYRGTAYTPQAADPAGTAYNLRYRGLHYQTNTHAQPPSVEPKVYRLTYRGVNYLVKRICK
jgi:hypothetical protein